MGRYKEIMILNIFMDFILIKTSLSIMPFCRHVGNTMKAAGSRRLNGKTIVLIDSE